MPYTLPDDINPDRVSVCVPVPNDTNHKRAFLAQIDELQYWWNWDRDPTKSLARDTAAVWREISDTVATRLWAGEDCGVPTIKDVRLTDCTLEIQYTDSEDWVTVGRVMTPEPSCDFEGEVGIVRDDVQDASLLRLVNSRNVAGEDSSSTIDNHLVDDGGVDRIASRLRTIWSTKAGDQAELRFSAWANGSETRLLDLNNSAYNMRLRADKSAANNALQIFRIGASWATHIMVSILVQSIHVFQVLANGQVNIRRQNNSANQSRPALTIDAFGDAITPAAGFGASVDFTGSSSSTDQRALGAIEATWDVATDATRSSEIRLKAADNSGQYSVIRAAAAGGLTKFGVHGATPVEKPIVTGESEYEALTGLLAALDTVGLIQDSTDFVADEPGEGGGTTIIEMPQTTYAIYKDLRQDPYGVSEYGAGDNADWVSTFGVRNGTDGFKVAFNFSDFHRILKVRLYLQSDLTNSVYLKMGINIATAGVANTEFLNVELGTGSLDHWYEFDVNIETRNQAVISWQCELVGYNPAVDGAIILVAFDYTCIGMPSLHAEQRFRESVVYNEPDGAFENLHPGAAADLPIPV